MNKKITCCFLWEKTFPIRKHKHPWICGTWWGMSQWFGWINAWFCGTWWGMSQWFGWINPWICGTWWGMSQWFGWINPWFCGTWWGMSQWFGWINAWFCETWWGMSQWFGWINPWFCGTWWGMSQWFGWINAWFCETWWGMSQWFGWINPWFCGTWWGMSQWFGWINAWFCGTWWGMSQWFGWINVLHYLQYCTIPTILVKCHSTLSLFWQFYHSSCHTMLNQCAQCVPLEATSYGGKGCVSGNELLSSSNKEQLWKHCEFSGCATYFWPGSYCYTRSMTWTFLNGAVRYASTFYWLASAEMTINCRA